jgi:hypothetical protein
MRPKPLIVIALSTVAIIGAIPSRAQDAASAKAFLVNIYGHYKSKGKGIDFDGPHSALYFHSSLLALEKADVKATEPGYAPAIDWDPICGCQDMDGIWNLKIDVQLQSPQRAIADVSFALFDPKDRPTEEPSKLQITLVRENGGWRIWDILDKSDPKFTSSVRKLLEDDLARLRRKTEHGTSP